MRLMDPPRRPSVSPLYSFCTRPTRPGGKEPTITSMLNELVKGLGLRRDKLKEAFDGAKEIDEFDKFLADRDAPPRRRTRRK
jgi:hypothetical protein